MRHVIFYDTETTGLPNWKSPSESENQPHLVQVAAIVADSTSREIVSELDVIVRPDGWEIPSESTEIHGITNERALDEGLPERQVMLELYAFSANRMRVAHNRTFDQRLIRIALKRYQPDLCEEWGRKDNHECTMLLAKPIMQLPPKGQYGWKSPTLAEAYKYFTGKELEGAHNAMVDAKACMEVYWAIKDQTRTNTATT